ncbi:hypothetical protein [Acinetobacter guillouiae]|uniref:hypothetical protein n=1 Tax=Acinetobacter guillouiae TaxID=106649 RepID=UPI0026E3EF46|nr:hypothetical protein [Acinetobacter guillouiae]MDO6646199.1 hypothetical protein [Acinetobacter guillouiae]
MATPARKKKTDDVISTLASLGLGQTLSEFNYARCKKLLAESKDQTPLELWRMLDSLTELNFNNLKTAHALAVLNADKSTNLSVLRNAHYVFNHTLDYVKASQTIEKIIDLTEKSNLDLSQLPSDFILEFYLSGRLEELLKRKSVIEKFKDKIETFQNLDKWNNIDSEKLRMMMNIIHSVVISNNARCWSFEYSVVEGEFLISASIDASYEKLLYLDNQIFDECYKLNLIDELNVLSFGFHPFDGVQEND